MPDVLICDRDRSFTASLEKLLEGSGYAVETSEPGSPAIQKLLGGSVGLVVLRIHVDDGEGLEMIPLIHQIDRELPIIAVGDTESLEMERKVRVEKVFYYMVQPLDVDEVREVVDRAMQAQGKRGASHP